MNEYCWAPYVPPIVTPVVYERGVGVVIDYEPRDFLDLDFEPRRVSRVRFYAEEEPSYEPVPIPHDENAPCSCEPCVWARTHDENAPCCTCEPCVWVRNAPARATAKRNKLIREALAVEEKEMAERRAVRDQALNESIALRPLELW